MSHEAEVQVIKSKTSHIVTSEAVKKKQKKQQLCIQPVSSLQLMEELTST